MPGALIVALNVSPRQFEAGNLVHIVRKVLAASGLDPTRLCIAITERLMLDDSEKNLATIAELKARGIQIAIDDFGVGYSSLSYIRRFHPTELKIDCSLTRRIADDPGDAAVVQAAIAMAHSLKLRVVAKAWRRRHRGFCYRLKVAIWRRDFFSRSHSRRASSASG
jgi:EAL domain-containing protein (putative c-di-GMP-specific phosphodiesterase class I)